MKGLPIGNYEYLEDRCVCLKSYVRNGLRGSISCEGDTDKQLFSSILGRKLLVGPRSRILLSQFCLMTRQSNEETIMDTVALDHFNSDFTGF